MVCEELTSHLLLLLDQGQLVGVLASLDTVARLDMLS